MPGILSKLRDNGIPSNSKDDNYWRVQEALKKPGLEQNPEYIKWKQKQLETEEGSAVEPVSMA